MKAINKDNGRKFNSEIEAISAETELNVKKKKFRQISPLDKNFEMENENVDVDLCGDFNHSDRF